MESVYPTPRLHLLFQYLFSSNGSSVGVRLPFAVSLIALLAFILYFLVLFLWIIWLYYIISFIILKLFYIVLQISPVVLNFMYIRLLKISHVSVIPKFLFSQAHLSVSTVLGLKACATTQSLVLQLLVGDYARLHQFCFILFLIFWKFY